MLPGWLVGDGENPEHYPYAESAYAAAKEYIDANDWGYLDTTEYITTWRSALVLVEDGPTKRVEEAWTDYENHVFEIKEKPLSEIKKYLSETKDPPRRLSGPAPQPTSRRMLLQFRMRRDLGAMLEAAAAETGISVHQLARDIVEGVVEKGCLAKYLNPWDYTK